MLTIHFLSTPKNRHANIPHTKIIDRAEWIIHIGKSNSIQQMGLYYTTELEAEPDVNTELGL